MDQKAYKKMVRDSAVFENFSDEFKKRLLNAKGADAARYVATIMESNTFLADAQRDMTERNTKVIAGLKTDLHRIEKEKNVSVEARVRRDENATGENLLEELNNIN